MVLNQIVLFILKPGMQPSVFSNEVGCYGSVKAFNESYAVVEFDGYHYTVPRKDILCFLR